MKNNLNSDLTLISSSDEIDEFMINNEKTIEILEAICPQLLKHFPNSKFSLEVSQNLNWTIETKLLLNVHIDEEMFFNGMLDHFNDIYAKIEPIIEDILCQ